MNIENKILSYEVRKRYKKWDLYRKTNKIWNIHKFNSREKIGIVNQLVKSYYKELNDKNDFDEGGFLKYYTEHAKTLSDLYDISLDFNKILKTTYDINVSETITFNFVIMRVIDESVNGLKREILILNYLKGIYNNKYNVRLSDYYTDINYRIDIEVFDDRSNIKEAYQVKPISYIYSIKYKNSVNHDICMKDHNYNVKKQEQYKDKHNCDIYYITANEDISDIKIYDCNLNIIKR